MLTVEERLARYRDVLDTTPALERVGPERSPRRVALTIAVVALVAIAVGGFVVVARVRDTAPQSPASDTERIGSWYQGAAPPFELQSPMQSAVTDDGRVVVLGGVPHAAEPTAPYGGGIYDPVSDSWKVIPEAPFNAAANFRLVGTMLMAVTNRDYGPVSGVAMLDLATLQWTTIDVPDLLSRGAPIWTWNGETLAMIHAGNSGLPDDTAEPFTIRWTLSDRAWHDGAPPPLTPRASPTSAVTADRIAVWGGFTTDPTIQSALPLDLNDPPVENGSTPTTIGILDAAGRPFTGAYTDGAIYDVAGDSWTSIPADGSLLDIARAPAAGLLIGDRLTVMSTYRAGGPRAVAEFSGGQMHRIAAPTAGGFNVPARGETLVVAQTLQSGPQPVQYFDPESKSWKDAPFGTLLQTERGLIALSGTVDNPGSGPFQGARAVDGGWQPTMDGPFDNRMEPVVEAVGDRVIVIGGEQGAQLESQNDTWILDLSTPSVTGD